MFLNGELRIEPGIVGKVSGIGIGLGCFVVKGRSVKGRICSERFRVRHWLLRYLLLVCYFIINERFSQICAVVCLTCKIRRKHHRAASSIGPGLGNYWELDAEILHSSR